MLSYTREPISFREKNGSTIASFLKADDINVDWKTVKSFGEEWKKFDEFSDEEIRLIGSDYFDIVTQEMMTQQSVVLDLGCGSGRWIKFVAPKVSFVEAIEPSSVVFSVPSFLSGLTNVRVTQATVETIPFADDSFDFIYSLGVLHHVPQTFQAIQRCVEKLKPGGWILIYLYYNLDNRSLVYKTIFQISNILRHIISHLPGSIKRFICDLIAAIIYLPLSGLSSVLSYLSLKAADSIPLGYYRKTRFKIMRNDSLDRFGTPLENRFSKKLIEKMLTEAGLTSIQFSNKAPYWHVVAKK